ncbi:MAG: glycosyltransferase, partial [Lachnospiraceae bacterium]|nr:glycosyltransferase [Lachnospiraceae bacterium]
MNPQVSIIVPVHNAQATLRRCVNSIIHQEYAELELLLIDDGSTDGSGAICDEFAAQDERIVVIHKENGGVSEARNLGLSKARGTYLQFADSDDWISPDATKQFVKAAQETDCDLVIADFYRVIGERLSPKGNIDETEAFSREKYAAYMMENPADFYYGVLWNKLFRREIVEKYKRRIDPYVSWCEDFMFNLEYIRHAKVFCALQI